MRKGYSHELLHTSENIGLSGYLVGDRTIEDIVKTTEIENLHFISRGQIPPNPSELLMSKRFAGLLGALESEYDLIIIDTPPILAVTDPTIIGAHAGTAFMLARFEQSSLKEIATAANRFELNGIEIKGLIFNAVEKRASSYYGDYGYYTNEYKT